MLPDFTQPAPVLAALLIGWELVVNDAAGVRGGIIIETEAYTADDPASHSYPGPSVRNAAMFMPAGTLYVYQIYGVHYCLNIVCGKGDGQAVLLRALQPTRGLDYMQARRKQMDICKLCSGPAKLVQALGITPALDKTHIKGSPITLIPPNKSLIVKTSPRIGISKAVDVPWRFFT